MKEPSMPMRSVALLPLVGQVVAQDAGGIERRDGDEVEDEEQDIHQDAVVEQQREGKERRQGGEIDGDFLRHEAGGGDREGANPGNVFEDDE